MFINSIFLPKNHSDQTPPEGADVKSGDFSHLFSNVYRIIEDVQEDNVSIQTEEFTNDFDTEVHEELLKVSLHSDNSSNLDIKNISMMVSSCLSKICEQENGVDIKDGKNVGMKKSFPKYFSLNKNELINEIKQIHHTLKNSMQGSSGKVEISLIANDQSRGINLSNINTKELENWITQESKLNKEFEILIKSGKMAIPDEIKPSLKENVLMMKSEDTIKSDSSKSINKINPEILSSTKTASDNKEVQLKQVLVAGIKTNTNEVKQKDGGLILKDNLIKEDKTTESAQKLNAANKKSEVIVNYKNQDQNSSTSIEKNGNHSKKELDDLIKKTNVKQIDINVQKITQTNKANIQKIQSQLQSDLFISKEILPNNFSSELVNGKEKLKSSNNTVILNSEQSVNKENVDLMLRRVNSKIPPLEVLTDESNNIDDSKKSIVQNKNHKIVDDSVKNKSNGDNNVWVKVSLEKTEFENSKEIKNQTSQQNKITIDKDINGEFDQNTNTGKESNSNNTKQTNTTVDLSQNNSQKISEGNQSIKSQVDLVSSIKPEIKIENGQTKSASITDTTKFISHNAEMIEKIKIISSGEMLREVYKVFESGEKQSIVLRLTPKELGSIKIMLDSIDNVLSAKVEVQNESVGQMIKNNVEQLKQSLLQNGVHLNSINISYHNSEQKQSGFQNQKKKTPSFKLNDDIETVDESVITKRMGYNTYEYLA